MIENTSIPDISSMPHRSTPLPTADLPLADADTSAKQEPPPTPPPPPLGGGPTRGDPPRLRAAQPPRDTEKVRGKRRPS